MCPFSCPVSVFSSAIVFLYVQRPGVNAVGRRKIVNSPWGSSGRKRQQQQMQDFVRMAEDVSGSDGPAMERQPKDCRICSRSCCEDDQADKKKKIRWNYAKQARVDPVSGLEIVSGKECHYCVKVLFDLLQSLFCACLLLLARSCCVCVCLRFCV